MIAGSCCVSTSISPTPDMAYTIRGVMGTVWIRVYHSCGERMLHLNTYQRRSKLLSDWWCNKCAESETIGGSEQSPCRLEPAITVPKVPDGREEKKT